MSTLTLLYSILITFFSIIMGLSLIAIVVSVMVLFDVTQDEYESKRQ